MKIWMLVVLLSVLSSIESPAQGPKTTVTLGAGRAFLGTGDIGGFTFFNEFEVRLKKRISVNPGIQFTNHSGSYNFTNYEYRFVTTGITVYTSINYAILLKPRHRIAIGVGPSLRYQSSSAPSNIGVSNEQSGVPVLEFNYHDPASTWSLGYIVAPQYQIQISRKLFAGARFMLQNDTRGDIITSQVLNVGVNLY